MKHALTKRQGDVYGFIRTYTKDKAMAPSYSEIARGVGMSSKSEVYSVLKRLENRGYISRIPGRPRSITIVSDESEQLRDLHGAALEFIDTQEKFRALFDEDQTSESTLDAGSKVTSAWEALRKMVKGKGNE